jgi:SAM-dependent methyltransferase
MRRFPLIEAIRSALVHPLTRGLALDDPRTTERRRLVVLSKPGLRTIYEDWYHMLARRIPARPGGVLEIGSGAGFLKRLIPDAITSEIMSITGIDLVCDACRLPFAEGSMRAIVMVDVLHHIPDVEGFFAGASACLRPGGRMVMIEPWMTALSRHVYQRFHHEPCDPLAGDWRFPSSGPLSSANGALPWMIFSRDLERFHRQFQRLQLAELVPFMPLRYLFSAGIGNRIGAPAWLDALLKRVEGDLMALRKVASMFALIVVERT